MQETHGKYALISQCDDKNLMLIVVWI